MEGYWVPGLSHGTDYMEKAKAHPSFMMSEQLYLGQELLSEEGLESALPGARPRGGKDSFVGQENRPHPRARSFLSHINSGANTGTGIPPPCCPQGQGLTLMEGARWALAAGAGRGGRAASAAPAGGQRGSLRVTQRGGRNRTHPAGGAALPASRTRGQDGDPPRGTQRGPEG